MNNVVDKFTTHLRSVLTRALCFVSDAGASEIGPEHLLWSVATEDGSIGAEILKKASLDVEVLGKLVGAPTELDISTLDVTSIPVLSEHSKKIIEKAVLTAAVYEHSFVGTEHLVAGLLQAGGRDLAEVVKHTSLHIDNVRKQLNTILQGTRQFPNIQNPVGDVVRDTEELVDDSSALEFFATELTSLEQNLDPVIGRDDEINRMLEILSRRTKNNPLLIGDPGVGKTAIVEGLARRIVEGKVPPSLKEKRIFALDMSSLVAGTIYRGEFEGRLKQIVEEVRDRPEVILFIDEIHTITGAGAAAGSIDAANMLKPALARGWIRCIGATTPDEYKKSIESDGALDRRMQTVRVEEPSVDDTIDILRGIAPLYEEHHKVSIDDDALVYAAQASDRYMPSEHLPDKAIDLVDEAAASLQLKGKAYARIVTSSTIADAVFKKTGVRVSGQLKSDDAARLRGLSKKLKTRLFGQDEVVEAVSTHVRRAKLGVSSSSRPLASFLFVGPSGTGKSELARLLATELYSREDALVRLDMSEFVEGYSVSKLVGSPAGYVGYRD